MRQATSKNGDLIRIEEGKGRCRLLARIILMGKHIVVTITGGAAHIGAVALAEPYPSRVDPAATSASVSVLTRTTHKEDDIARHIASEAASALGVPVLVCFGIHLEDINLDEIEEISRNAETLLRKIIEILHDIPEG